MGSELFKKILKGINNSKIALKGIFTLSALMRPLWPICGILENFYTDHGSALSYYQTTIDRFKKYRNEVKNVLKCLKNHIKVLKRNAHDFRNF